MMKAAASAACCLIPLSLAVRTPPSAPGGAGSAMGGVGPSAGWDLCAVADPAAAPAAGALPIPRVLHQTYKTADLPPTFHQSHESWLHKTPGWERHIWTDADNRALIATHYPWFLSTYDSYPDEIERSDVSRYFTLHRYGGIYADLDIEALRDPALLISGGRDLVLFYDWALISTYQLIANAVMASAPEHPFWMFLAKRLIKKSKDPFNYVPTARDNWLGREQFERVLNTTGPWMLTEAVNEFMEESPLTQASIYPAKYWSPSRPDVTGYREPCDDPAICRGKYPEAILFHHSVSSWVDWRTEGAYHKLSLVGVQRCY